MKKNMDVILYNVHNTLMTSIYVISHVTQIFQDGTTHSRRSLVAALCEMAVLDAHVSYST